MALANVEQILIRLLYTDQTQREVELLNIIMDSAASSDRGLGSASLVEECRCPSGYTGLSCENCAHGYVRQKTGPWLGRCAPDAEPCRPGTYGDPFNGVPCRECPCPLSTDGQNFARSCSLQPNGRDVRCDCKQGYAGTRCEVCATGYVGNPLEVGGSCEVYRPPVSRCDARGTELQLANGQCQCKRFVTGPQCNQCTPDAYHLGEDGCTECFCMGVSQQCSSSSWYRDTVRAYPAVGQFALISDVDNPEVVPIDISVAHGQEVSARFQPSDTQTYWWKLPVAFAGNQLAAYGGHLNYTVRFATQPGGVMSRNVAPDVVIRSRNDYTLMHYRRADDELQPGSGQSYAVRIAPDQWRRPEGEYVTREHLLMALADVTDIFVKATYTTTSSSAGLLAVSLDTAAAVPRGSSAVVRASEVEQCVCPEGHEGLSCERCSAGYGRDPEGGDGLYLGLCRRCQCNGHAQDCDAETGVCQQCRHNTAGDQCEQCAPGYQGNATLGTAYDCQEIEQPDQHGCSECDRSGTATCDENGCQCKANVEGRRCDRCRDGTFGLNETNRLGCTECFCAGVTRNCAAAPLWRLPIPINPFEDQLSLTDRRAGKVVSANQVQIDIGNNRYSYRLEDGRRDTLYWSLSERFVGNQVLSYGGALQFTVGNEGYGPYVPDQDVLLIGNGLTLFWIRKHANEETSVVRLLESEFQSNDRNNGLRPASRADLLTVLSDLQSILVRATLRSEVDEAYISDILLDTAVPQETDVRADEVEKCQCPAGYRGTSCEVRAGADEVIECNY